LRDPSPSLRLGITPVFEVKDKRAVAHIAEGKKKMRMTTQIHTLFNKTKKAQSITLCAFDDN
jgi:hypothetical protein